MIKTKISWSVANIEKMFKEKKTLCFDHPIQRQGGQWTILQKSLLLHSMLANYPIPQIYVIKEDSEEMDAKGKSIFQYSVLDGKQRLTNVLSFLDGEFVLDENIPSVTLEDEIYEIAGKYFQDLDEEVQHEIKRFKFDIYCFENCTNDDVEEIFIRLNNSTPLTSSQLSKAKIGSDLATFVNEALQSKFFKEVCNFSKAQVTKNENQRCLFQSMMLLDNCNEKIGYELKSFSENDILSYCEGIKGNYDNVQMDDIVSCNEFLGDTFPQKTKTIRKINIPMLFFIANFSMEHGIKPIYVRQWWSFFQEEDERMEVYKTFCSSGSTKLEKIKGRLVIMTQSFCDYMEVEMPKELEVWNQEVEDILKAREDILQETIEEIPMEEVQKEEETPMEEEATPLKEEAIMEEESMEETSQEEAFQEAPAEQEENTSMEENCEEIHSNQEEI